MSLTESQQEIISPNGGNFRQRLMWMSWSGAVSIANSIALWIFIARWREPEELGRFTIVMGLYALFFTICSMGLPPYLVSEISRRRGKKAARFIGSAAGLLFVSGMLCAVLMSVGGLLASESFEVRRAAAILSLAMIPTGLIGVAEASAIAGGRARLIAFVSTFENILRTVVPLALLRANFDISVICASFVAVRLAALAIYLIAERRMLAKLRFVKKEFFEILKMTPTFAATIVLASLNWQIAVFLLGRIGTEIESAKFGAASRFLIPATILMASYAGVMQPHLARLNAAEARRYLAKMARLPLLAAAAAAALSPFLSRPVISFLFGEKYAEAASVLNILALSVVPFCLVMLTARGLIAANAPRIDLFANALGVMTGLIFGWSLIPKYGAKGAAIAQLAAFVVMALVEIFYFFRMTNNLKGEAEKYALMSGHSVSGTNEHASFQLKN